VPVGAASFVLLNLVLNRQALLDIVALIPWKRPVVAPDPAAPG